MSGHRADAVACGPVVIDLSGPRLVAADRRRLAGAFKLSLAFVALLQQRFNTPKAPIVVPWWLSLGSCALVLLICLVSALLPYIRVRKVDPIMVLQG